MANLRRAIETLPIVLIFDNSAIAAPFRKVAEVRNGEILNLSEPMPGWLRAIVRSR